MQFVKQNQLQLFLFALICGSICLAGTVQAQGSIFGQVVNSDLSFPSNGQVSFFGFINNSDDEIRIESSVGAGYDSGNWYDDFQNFLGESDDLPYRYYFTNATNGQTQILAKLIPNNSFQQENIMLETANHPDPPEWITAVCVADSQKVFLSWQYQPNHTYHLYRRLTSAGGSFYRIDDPTGSLLNSGLTDSTYVDQAIDCNATFQYLLIAEDQAGQYSGHSDTLSALPGLLSYACGDANSDERVNVGDAVFLVNFIFKDGGPPFSFIASDSNCDGRVNVGDAVYLINYVFKFGPEPCAWCL